MSLLSTGQMTACRSNHRWWLDTWDDHGRSHTAEGGRQRTLRRHLVAQRRDKGLVGLDPPSHRGDECYLGFRSMRCGEVIGRGSGKY